MTGKLFAGLLAGALIVQPAFAAGAGEPKNDPNAQGSAATQSGAADLNAKPRAHGAREAMKSGTGSSSDESTATHRKKHKGKRHMSKRNADTQRSSGSGT